MRSFALIGALVCSAVTSIAAESPYAYRGFRAGMTISEFRAAARRLNTDSTATWCQRLEGRPVYTKCALKRTTLEDGSVLVVLGHFGGPGKAFMIEAGRQLRHPSASIDEIDSLLGNIALALTQRWGTPNSGEYSTAINSWKRGRYEAQWIRDVNFSSDSTGTKVTLKDRILGDAFLAAAQKEQTQGVEP
jgi:hypothetical protein